MNPSRLGRQDRPSARGATSPVAYVPRAERLAWLLCSLVGVFIATASSAGELEDLRRKVDQQESIISGQAGELSRQQGEIDRQGEALDSLQKKVEGLESDGANDSHAAAPDDPDGEVDSESGSKPEFATIKRDEVGDLNSEAVEKGDFPGAIRIPGPWKTSLRIGGFVKVLTQYDTDAEDMGVNFVPATLGTRRSDDDGAFSIDATLTRLLLDARAPTKWGPVRGYVEWDLNDNNNGDLDVNWRHAYGTFETDYGTLLVGHTWSTFMDLGILPEGLAEPTVSGVVFQRQAQVRWVQPLSQSFRLYLAIEDPSSDDVYNNNPDPDIFNTETPDGVVAFEYLHGKRGHLRVNSILRQIEVNLPTSGEDSELGWGLSLSGSLRICERDWFRFMGVYGEGLGRYLLGIQPSAGGSIDPVDESLSLNENWGVMGAFEHHWRPGLRSTAMAGYAKADRAGTDPVDAFESTIYSSANLMWSPLPFFTVGIEYAYGRRENRDGSDLDNHRVGLGFQIF